MNLLPALRPKRLLVLLLAVVTAVAAAVALSVTQPGAARAATTKTAAAASAGGAKPTIVLVHGAWADGSSWNAVSGQLIADGYTVDVPPNTLRGTTQDSAYLRDYLTTIKGPIVLVYVDAYLPAKGETLGFLNSKSPNSCVSSTSVLTTAPFPGSTATNFDTYIKQSWFPGCFANYGIPATEAAEIAAEQRPTASDTFTEKSGVPAWKTIPSWAVVGTVDKVIEPHELVAMAKRAHARITEIKAPHLSMVSDPGAVTGVILKAVYATN